jgi:hypothetical protein
VARFAASSETTSRRARESTAPASSRSDEGGSYIGGLQAAGLKDLTVDQIIALKIHGVTPEYIRELSAAGLANLRVQDYLAARVQGITPEFVQRIRAHGFKDLTLRQLISLKIADIS